MSVFDAAALPQTLRNLTEFPPVCLFIGEEDAVVSEGLAATQAKFLERLGNALPEFNVERLDGARDPDPPVTDACGTLPVGSDRRLVLLQNLEKVSEGTWSRLEEYLRSPNPSTTLVLSWNARPNERAMAQGLARAAAQKGWVVRCWRLDREDRRCAWIRDRAKEYGRAISEEACAVLSEEGGETVRELRSEVEKCVLYVGERRAIEARDVRATMSFRRQQLVWDFTEGLEGGRWKEAGRALELCLAQREEPVRMLNLFARSARRMAAQKSVARWKKMKQLALFNGLKEADLLLKTGHGPESGVFEQLLVQAAEAS